MKKSVYIVAVENSADHLGAELIEQINLKWPDIECLGIGGLAMRSQGVLSQIDITGLAILGFIEGVKSYPLILKRVKETVSSIMMQKPNIVVLIDSWGFMIRVAQRLKQAGYKGKIVKYLAPQVWAMREGRSKILAKSVDHLMTIHSFDAPYFEKHGLPVTYVGNPIFDTHYLAGESNKLKSEYDIKDNHEILSVFFGSRISEIETLAPVFAETIRQLKSAREHLKIISPVSDTITSEVNAAVVQYPQLQDITLLPERRKLDVFAVSHAALACSGTVTTQLACAGVPTIVAYKLNPLTFAVAKRLYKPNYISIVNIAAQAELMPEFIQSDVTADNLSREISKYLDNKAYRKESSEKLIEQTTSMQGKGGLASQRAAQTIAGLL